MLLLGGAALEGWFCRDRVSLVLLNSRGMKQSQWFLGCSFQPKTKKNLLKIRAVYQSEESAKWGVSGSTLVGTSPHPGRELCRGPCGGHSCNEQSVNRPPLGLTQPIPASTDPAAPWERCPHPRLATPSARGGTNLPFLCPMESACLPVQERPLEPPLPPRPPPRS